ncbi:ABC transporter permease [Bacillus sp. JCM 19034]|uniref:ABC transporter permease n=1 Tax=Bacillus sp. JCM 19034 TaxID=1481928 RepID=UPI000AAECE11
MTDHVPMGVTTNSILGDLTIFVSENVFSELLGLDDRVQPGNYIYLGSSDPLKTQEELEALDENNMYIYNLYQSRQQSEQLVMLMSVFVYGFIVLITVISIANIFNTISTSISLRKREFAMLKSVGMTPKSFTRMINYESVYYGVKSLLYACR